VPGADASPNLQLAETLIPSAALNRFNNLQTFGSSVTDHIPRLDAVFRHWLERMYGRGARQHESFDPEALIVASGTCPSRKRVADGGSTLRADQLQRHFREAVTETRAEGDNRTRSRRSLKNIFEGGWTLLNETKEVKYCGPRSPGRDALACVTVLALVLLAGCGNTAQVSTAAPSGDGWRDFEGTWTAAGNRTIIRLGGDRQAAVSTFRGSLVLAGPSRPGVGFLSEAIVFNDSTTGLIGRAVWTNENGEEAYSELRGEGTAAANKITGTFVGGTGPFAGVAGDYEFSWRFLLENDDGIVQGQSMGLKGRVRLRQQHGGSTAGGN
jgi:hypothetical protein